MLGFVIGYALLPTVSASANEAATDGNLTESPGAVQLVRLGPLFFVILILIVGIGAVIHGLIRLSH